jgi:hypothetical protein
MLGLAKTIVSSPLGKAALIFLGVKSLADLANIVTGQEEAAKIITERGTDVQRGKALDIKGVDTMGEKYKTPLNPETLRYVKNKVNVFNRRTSIFRSSDK